MADQRYAVIIGVDRPDAHATMPASDHARAIRDTLIDPEIGTFPPENVTLCTGPGASAAEIKAVLRRIALRSSRSDLLVVYFAGRTLSPSWSHLTDVYLVTPDLDESALGDDPDAGLRMAFLARDVFQVFAGTTLLILDCCRAGSLTAARGIDMLSFGGRDDPRHAVLAACADDGLGALTDNVVEALRGAAADHRGLVTFEAVTHHVRGRQPVPAPAVLLQPQGGSVVLTRPGAETAGAGRPVPPPQPDAVEVVALENPIDRHAPDVTGLIGRLSAVAAAPGTARVEYLKDAVGAASVGLLTYDASGFTAIDATAGFALADVRHLLRTEGDPPFPLNPRWFGHVATDGVRRLWCAPLDRAGDRVMMLAVTDPPTALAELGQPGAKVLETVWRADFAASPAEAEIQVLTSLRAAFGRLPLDLFERCLRLYREVIESFQIVFQPVITIGEAPAQVGVHSYEALARRSLDDQRAPFAMLQIAHTWGDHFVVERDKIILRKALSAYARAHADGPWDVQKPVSINVSVRSLLADSYVDTLHEAIAAFHLDPGSVTLEISEQDEIAPWAGEQWRDEPHAYFHNRLATVAREVGVAFAVDDFGTGYASVSRMAELPLTQIKVDRAILHHRQALQELDLVVAVARDAIDRGETHTARAVIVEGVDEDSPLTLRQIYKRGIKHVQGYITQQRGAAELRRLPAEIRKDIAARVRGDGEHRPTALTRRHTRDNEQPLRRGA